MVSTEVNHPDIGEAGDTEDYGAVRHVTVTQAEIENILRKSVLCYEIFTMT